MPITPRTLLNMSIKADREVDFILSRGANFMIKTPKAEVGYVAAIALDGVFRIGAAWQQLLAHERYKLNLTSVFCHATPQITYSKAHGVSRCELADLLVVVDLPRVTPLRIASLIQVKMANRAQRVAFAGQSSQKQLYLYQNWPRFYFVETANFGTDIFDIQKKVPDAGTFGIIDRHLKNSIGRPPVWAQHAAHIHGFPNSARLMPLANTHSLYCSN
jgi:hypothetical protein